jgi:hypothetical protein
METIAGIEKMKAIYLSSAQRNCAGATLVGEQIGVVQQQLQHSQTVERILVKCIIFILGCFVCYPFLTKLDFPSLLPAPEQPISEEPEIVYFRILYDTKPEGSSELDLKRGGILLF